MHPPGTGSAAPALCRKGLARRHAGRVAPRGHNTRKGPAAACQGLQGVVQQASKSVRRRQPAASVQWGSVPPMGAALNCGSHFATYQKRPRAPAADRGGSLAPRSPAAGATWLRPAFRDCTVASSNLSVPACLTNNRAWKKAMVCVDCAAPPARARRVRVAEDDLHRWDHSSSRSRAGNLPKLHGHHPLSSGRRLATCDGEHCHGCRATQGRGQRCLPPQGEHRCAARPPRTPLHPQHKPACRTMLQL